MENTLHTVYENYADVLYRLALSHLNHREDALDAVQDVFVKYATSPKRFKDREHERAWFIRVLINHCHDLQRKRSHRQHLPLDDAYNLPSSEDCDRPAVFDAIELLSDSLKSVVVLHYLEGFSVDETADILRLSRSAVKMRLSRARDTLKSHLQKEGYHV